MKAGRKGRIVLKMNGLHDQNMINELYNASENGVEIDLIVRGICCLVPNRPFSANIKVTRIVDMFLEHSRIWYFYNDGEEGFVPDFRRLDAPELESPYRDGFSDSECGNQAMHYRYSENTVAR